MEKDEKLAHTENWTQKNGVTYKGEALADGTPHGQGRLQLPNSDYLEGIFENGKLRHGIVSKKGTIYQGTFRNQELHGTGRITFHPSHTNQSSHEGQFENGVLIEGKVTMDSGNYFIGELVSKGKVPKVHEGTWYRKNGKIRSKGIFENGELRQGIVSKKGTIYQGTFRNGKLHGEGRIIFRPSHTNQSSHEGQFENGVLIEGKVTMDSGNYFIGELVSEGKGPKVHEGTWYRKNGKIRSKGIFENGELRQGIVSKKGTIYQGTFRNGKLHGEGRIIFRPSHTIQSSHEGQFENGVLIEGKVTMDSGSYFIGKLVSKEKGPKVHEGAWYDKTGKIQSKGKHLNLNLPISEGDFNPRKINYIPTIIIPTPDLDMQKKAVLYRGKYANSKDSALFVIATCEEDRPQALVATIKQEAKKVKTDAVRLVFMQHGLNNGINDFNVGKKHATKILKNLIDKGFKDIRISSYSCNSGEAVHFKDAALDLTQNPRYKKKPFSIRIRSFDDNQDLIIGTKYNPSDGKVEMRLHALTFAQNEYKKRPVTNIQSESYGDEKKQGQKPNPDNAKKSRFRRALKF